MPILQDVLHWQPFSIDALGVLTLLGANTLETALGRLVISPIAEYLPLLAAQVVLENTIAEPLPGFAIYNITEGIRCVEVSGWFTRWLLCQDLTRTSTTFDINVLASPRKYSALQILNMVVSILLGAFLIVFSVLLTDWYAVACSVSVVVSSMVRTFVLLGYRRALDDEARESNTNSTPVRLVVTLPSGKLVTVNTTNGITVNCLLGEFGHNSEGLIASARNMGWLSFGIFIVTMGQACLTMQLILVFCILIPSICIIKQLGCNEYEIGSWIEITRHDFPGKEYRARAYAALDLSDTQEQNMVDWGFFPMRSNTNWWTTYKACEDSFRKDPSAFDNWKESLATVE